MNATVILSALRDMGNTPDEIAGWLEARGVRGQRKSREHCPLANYLHSRFNETAQVGGPGIRVGWTLISEGVLPSATRRFITSFDFGMYPELISNVPLSDDSVVWE